MYLQQRTRASWLRGFRNVAGQTFFNYGRLAETDSQVEKGTWNKFTVLNPQVRVVGIWWKNYQAISKLGELSTYSKKPQRAISNKIATDLAYCKHGKRIMVDDSNNYVDAASKKQNVGFSSIASSGKLINFQIYS